MKKIYFAIAFIIGVMTPFKSSAQYYEIANQLPGLIRPALTGGFNYKGYVDAKYLKGIGSRNVDFLGFSTSQGFRYNSWFYMGVGIGVDVVFSHTDDDFGSWDYNDPAVTGHGSTSTGAMIPLFTDFRFNIGGQKGASFYIDLRLGCSFLVGKDYLEVGNGYLTSQEYFYLNPSMGVRIPVGNSSKQAFDIGLSYQMLTSDYWSSYNTNLTLNALGATISYEW